MKKMYNIDKGLKKSGVLPKNRCTKSISSTVDTDYLPPSVNTYADLLLVDTSSLILGNSYIVDADETNKTFKNKNTKTI
jgi:hypothetical protein